MEDEAGDRLEVNVEGEDAQDFLSTPPPKEIDDPKEFMKLKEHLKIVFGNLVEVHERLTQGELIKHELAPPFDMCVKSWEMLRGKKATRMYNLFGCRIVP